MPAPPDAPPGAGSRTLGVRVETMTETTGPSGAPIETWATLYPTTYMERIDLTATERLVSQQIEAKFDTRWRLPYQRTMDPDLVDVTKYRRLVYGDRVHDITSARVVGHKRAIELETIASGASDNTP